MTTAAALIFEWASERRIRRRRDDRSYGSPDVHWAEEWGTYCEERGICQRDAVFEVMDGAKAGADGREQGRFWKYLNEQVQHAAERCAAAVAQVQPRPQQVAVQPDEDSRSEWARVKSILASRLDAIAYANWIARTYQVGRPVQRCGSGCPITLHGSGWRANMLDASRRHSRAWVL